MVFKTLVLYILIVGWKTCDSWLICNLFNQNIKSLSNVKFEIKSWILNMFQLNKNEKILYLKKICCDEFLWFLKSCPSQFASNLQPFV
jgi:hypothetical protein